MTVENGGPRAPRRVELLWSPGCPHVDAVRHDLQRAIGELRLDVAVQEHVGRFPSPTVLVDGLDVVTAAARPMGSTCRLDVPDYARLLSALSAASAHPAGG